MFIAAYVGARPLGRPLPPLAAAPQASATVPLYLIYSFARDAAHDGRFEFYDPWQLESAVKQQCGNQRGMLSLAGAGFSWAPAVGLDVWVGNAVASLQHMLDRYGLVGLDIDYEEGLTEASAWQFPESMAAVIAQLKAWRPRLLVTVSPYTLVWPHYQRLLQLAGDSIDYINWQLYAELESPDTTAQQAVAAYERLAREVGGYGRLTLGVNTEPDQRRGPQLPAILEAFRELKARGIGGAFVWALDNSYLCGYQAEAALLRMAEETSIDGPGAAAAEGAAALAPAALASTGSAGSEGHCRGSVAQISAAPTTATMATSMAAVPATSVASVLGGSSSYQQMLHSSSSPAMPPPSEHSSRAPRRCCSLM